MDGNYNKPFEDVHKWHVKMSITDDELKVIYSNKLYFNLYVDYVVAFVANDKEKIKQIIDFSHGTEFNRVLVNIYRRNKREG